MNDNIIDESAQQVLDNLSKHFTFTDISAGSRQGICPIGVEVEVKWRYYFPELWDKYLKSSSYKDLSVAQQNSLTLECSALEETLLPRLLLTEQCGVEKGQDKYYEFALPPAMNTGIILNQINLLKQENLIPSGEHSLHLTVGNLTATKDSYYLLLLLEMLYSDKERMLSAFHKDNKSLSSTWSRKGMGGIFLKEARDLKYGYQSAVELRTVQIKDDTNIEQLLNITSLVSDLIYNKDTDSRYEAWRLWVKATQDILISFGLTDKNWKKPNLEPDFWTNYIDNFDQLKTVIIPTISKKILPLLPLVNETKTKKYGVM